MLNFINRLPAPIRVVLAALSLLPKVLLWFGVPLLIFVILLLGIGELYRLFF